MAQVIVDRKDVDFVLHDQLRAEELSRHELFSDYNKKSLTWSSRGTELSS